MKQETLIMVAKLRRLAVKQGKSFDVARFVTDLGFAKTVLDDVLDSDDEEVLLTGLTLMRELGFTTVIPVVQAPIQPAVSPAPAVPVPPKTQGNTYIGRLR
jgi:hypothetical protein